MRGVRLLMFLCASLAAMATMWLVRGAYQGQAAAIAAAQRNTPVAQPEAPPPVATTDVLVATRDVKIGESLAAADLRWQAWPAGAVSPAYVTLAKTPDALTTMTGKVARARLTEGEPLTESKILALNGSGLMSVILRDGMRAVSLPVSDATSAGGFILPGDYVDVLLTRAIDVDVINKETGLVSRTLSENRTDTVLRYARVLAIDQVLGDEATSKAVVGATATLEVTPDQAEVLTLARQIAQQRRGFVALSLRSFTELTKESGGDLERIMPATVIDLREEAAAALRKAEESLLAFEENRKRAEEEKARAPVASGAAEEAAASKPAGPQAAPIMIVRNGVSAAIQPVAPASTDKEPKK